MLKKIVVLCLISLLSCNQLVNAYGVYYSQVNPPEWTKIDTPNELRELIDQCFNLMGYKHRVIRDHDYSNHPLYEQVKICSRYGEPLEEREWFDKNILGYNFTRQNIKTTANVDKQLEEIYKKIYLLIRNAGALEVFWAGAPYDWPQEFSKKTGLMEYLNELLKQNDFKFDSVDTEKAQIKFFGSAEKAKQAENAFYEEKMREYGIGKK
ncbi:hypothetical protein [Neisseria sp. Ec49-e6-T10]|uniref:hypothetical protein n=1 Tax=Neisseria sp. Ec49-e6-T10 TaxID=3140744 RepID=UPI003EBC7ED1